MKKQILLICAMIPLSGCFLTAERAANMSKYELCETMLNSKWNRETAYEALQRMDGGLEYCNKASDHIMASESRRSRNLSALSNTMMGLGQIQNQRTRRNPHVFCTSRTMGGADQVNCWRQ